MKTTQPEYFEFLSEFGHYVGSNKINVDFTGTEFRFENPHKVFKAEDINDAFLYAFQLVGKQAKKEIEKENKMNQF